MEPPVLEGAAPPGFSSDSGEPNVWSAALLYALFGLALVGIGLWLERRQPSDSPSLPPSRASLQLRRGATAESR